VSAAPSRHARGARDASGSSNKPLPGLAMSRSIGDMVVKPVGVTEEPERAALALKQRKKNS